MNYYNSPKEKAIIVNSMPPLSNYIRGDYRGYYLTPLPFSSYRTALTPDGKAKLFGYNNDGSRKLAFYKGDTRDGKHKEGEPVLNSNNEHVYEASGVYIEHHSGVEYRLYDSTISKLACSILDEDISLWNAFTGKNSHSPVFTGAVIFGTVIDEISGTKYPRIIEENIFTVMKVYKQ